MKEKDKINLEEFTYVAGQTVEIDGNVFIAMMNLCTQFKLVETKEVLLLNMPARVTGGVVEWRGAKPKEFFTQQPVEGLTELGAKSLDMEFTLCRIHEEHIRAGKATDRTKIINTNTEDEHRPIAD